MPGKHKTINHYQRLIHTYSERAELYKQRYGVQSKPYINARNKVALYKRGERRGLIKREKIRKFALLIKDYIGVDVTKSKDPKKIDAKIAKGIFIKYGMQNGFTGTDLGEYIGLKGRWSASKFRIRFTRQITQNKTYKEYYYGFLEYIKRNDVN